MTRKYTNRKYLDALEQKVLVFDGAMGTSLQLQNLTAEHFVTGWSRSHAAPASRHALRRLLWATSF